LQALRRAAWLNIAGMSAAMTENELCVESEQLQRHARVDRDSATRRARRLAVQFDAGELLLPCVAFVAEKLFRRLFFLAPCVLWLACRVQFIKSYSYFNKRHDRFSLASNS